MILTLVMLQLTDVIRISRGICIMSTNEYGLDYKYFERWINNILKTIDHYTPEQLARELSQMAYAADSEHTTREIISLNDRRVESCVICFDCDYIYRDEVSECDCVEHGEKQRWVDGCVLRGYKV